MITRRERFLARGGDAANLEAVNETPLRREVVVEVDTAKIKVGDGNTAYNDLLYVGPQNTDDLPEGLSNLYFTDARASSAAPVQSVNGDIGDVVIEAADVGAQPSDPLLTAIAALTTAADQLILATGDNTVAMLQLGAVGKNLLAAADAVAARTTLGLVGSQSLTQAGICAYTSSISDLNTVVGVTQMRLGSGAANTPAPSGFNFAGGISSRPVGSNFVSQLLWNAAGTQLWYRGSSTANSGNYGSWLLLARDDLVVHQAGDETITGVKTFSSSPLVPTGAGPQPAGPLDNPPNVQNANYTFTLSDRGLCVVKQSSGSATYTIPTDASVAFPVGSYINLAPTDASGSMSIVPASGVTLYMAGSRATTGTRTVVAGGLAAIMKMGANLWVISGSGVQ